MHTLSLKSMLFLVVFLPGTVFSWPACPEDPGGCIPWKGGDAEGVCEINGQTFQCSTESITVICHCNPKGDHHSRDFTIGVATSSSEENKLCGECNNNFCRKGLGVSHIKSYSCHAK